MHADIRATRRLAQPALARPASILAALALLGALIVPAGGARAAAADVFTIGNYPVQASDASAVAARDKAQAEGQQAALRSLFKRLVPVTAYKQLTKVAKLKAANLGSGVSVRSERNSSTEYIANLDFSFQADAVRQALQQQGIPFVDQQAPQVVVVPVWRQGNPPVAANDTGTWRNAWSGLDLAHTLTPVKLDELKKTIHTDTVTMLLNGDDNGLRIVAGEYGGDKVVFAVAEPDFAAKKLVVTLAGQDAVGPLTLKRVYRISEGDLAYAAELAAVVALGVLEGRWKAIKAPSAGAAGSVATAPAPATDRPVWQSSGSAGGAGQPVTLVAEFASQGQWNEIRTQLLDTPGVEDVEVGALSARSASVTLRFPGGAPGLANALGGRGLRLVDGGATGWLLRPTN